MHPKVRELAVVAGASNGIGFELARLCAKAHYDVVIAAEEPAIDEAAANLAATGALVIPVQCDLSTRRGVGELIDEINGTGRPVQALLANAGRTIGKAFLDQDIDEADAGEVARIGFDAMMRGEVSVMAGFAIKMRAAHAVADKVPAQMHRTQASPGAGKQ